MKTSLFDFDLPEDRIALRPAVPRDSARLLVVGDSFSDHTVRDLPSQLREGDVLVLNNTQVFPAALTGIRRARAHGGGGDVSIDINLHSQEGASKWRAFARPAKRLKPGDTLYFDILTAEVTQKNGGEVTLRFDREGRALEQAFDAIGMPPLPPYIGRKREVDARDKRDYQTVYAENRGSVAAPTAGLHFTPELFAALESRGVQIARVTLHVGAGTFLPMTAEDTDGHTMHAEHFSITQDTADALNAAKAEGRRIIAVGTTSLRALEGATTEVSQLVAQSHDTSIFIEPGYDFRWIDGLMTNFHLPKSTLFMLVSAVAGLGTMQAAYAHAIDRGYRFYSYGDSSLIWKAT